MSALSAIGLCAARGRRPVLHDVDLHVSSGEIVAVAGPNGSGKSTLLEVLAGQRAPAAGRVEVGARPIADLTGRERATEVAVMVQRFAAPDGFTARELVALGRAPHLGPWGLGGASDEAIVDGALQRCGVAHLASRPVERCSGGEQQRIQLALLVAQQARVWLLDEPTAAQDLDGVGVVAAVLAAHVAQGGSAVVVLHDLNLVDRLADRWVLLHRGAVVADGVRHALLGHPGLEVAWPGAVEVRPGPWLSPRLGSGV